ncbi:MAG: flagellar biosynthetic protein FliO [Sphingopyxis sp.]
MMGYFIYVITITVLFCAVAIFALKFWSKIETLRFSNARLNPDLQMLGVISASATVKLLAIRFQNRRLLLALTRQEVTMLSEVTARTEPEEKSLDFAGLLGSAREIRPQKKTASLMQAIAKITSPQRAEQQYAKPRRMKLHRTEKKSQ